MSKREKEETRILRVTEVVAAAQKATEIRAGDSVNR